MDLDDSITVSGSITTKYLSKYFIYLVAVLIGFLLLYSKQLLKNFKTFLELNSIQGPLAIPFAVTLQLIWTPYDGIFEKLNEYCKQFPGVFKLWIMQQPIVVVHSKENVRKILGSPDHLQKPEYYEIILNSIFGNRQEGGLVVADVDKWKVHRKLLTPAVNGRILEDFLEIVNEDCIKFSRAIRTELLTKLNECSEKNKEIGKIPIDLGHTFHNLFMGMIVETVVGVRDDYLEGSPNAPFTMQAGEDVKNMMLARSVNPLLRYDWLWNLHPLAKKVNKITFDCNAWFRKSIAARREQLREGKKKMDSNGIRYRQAIIDTLLEFSEDPSNQATEEYIAYELNTLILGGHDTTAHTMMICVYMLAIHPELQEKVYQETLDVFGGDIHRPATLADLSCLTFMEQFIKESQRMYPVVPMIMRKTGCDVVLEEGYKVAAGTTVAVWSPGLHRDSRVFPNPEVFDPENFSEEACKNMDQYAFVPYSGGLRNCIGRRLSVMQMKVILSRLLLDYRLVGADPNNVNDVRWLPRVVMGPSKRLQFYLEERK